MFNKNQRDGKIDEVKGKVKETVGELIGNEKLRSKGVVEQAVGKVKTAVGGLEKVVEKAGKS